MTEFGYARSALRYARSALRQELSMDLGFFVGRLKVYGMTLDEIQAVVKEAFSPTLHCTTTGCSYDFVGGSSDGKSRWCKEHAPHG